MPWQLIVSVTLEDVCARHQEMLHDDDIATMGCEMQSRPLMHTSRSVHIELFSVLEFFV